jgi:DNA-binding transcriptional LysR family regulator
LAPEAIASGDARLAAPLGFDPDGSDYALLHPAGLAVSPDIAALIDWIRAIAKG